MSYFKFIAIAVVGVCLLLPPEVRSESVVTEWNPIIVQATITDAPAPTIGTHVMSTIFTCAYEAWAAYDSSAQGNYTKNDFDVSEGSEVSRQEAVCHAIHTALSEWTPTNQAQFDAFMADHGYVPGATTEAALVGRMVAQAVLEARANDGSNRANGYADTTGYAPQDPSVLDSWQPVVFNGVPQKALTPHWGMVQPFALESGSQFRPPPPAAYGTPEWDAQIEQVINFSAQLTDTHKVIAEYWRPQNGTPPMLLASLTGIISEKRDLTLEEDVKLFFAIHNAMFDAGIACWEAKYFYDYVRPITAIQNIGDVTITAWRGPGLGTGEMLASEWYPYQARSSANAITPPFPEYVSGHSTFSSSWATIMEQFFGSSICGEGITIEESYFEGEDLEGPVHLFWPTFTTAAEEAGISRLYGGIHFFDGNTQALEMGKKIGREVWLKSSRLFHGYGTFDVRADINEDRVVDDYDLFILSENWRKAYN